MHRSKHVSNRSLYHYAIASHGDISRVPSEQTLTPQLSHTPATAPARPSPPRSILRTPKSVERETTAAAVASAYDPPATTAGPRELTANNVPPADRLDTTYDKIDPVTEPEPVSKASTPTPIIATPPAPSKDTATAREEALAQHRQKTATPPSPSPSTVYRESEGRHGRPHPQLPILQPNVETTREADMPRSEKQEDHSYTQTKHQSGHAKEKIATMWAGWKAKRWWHKEEKKVERIGKNL
jgi:hypothetical protein